jgi:hypothetical protein
MSERASAAAEYAALGLPIFPLHYVRDDGTCSCGRACSSVGKHPMTANGVKDASGEAAIVKAWWADQPLANIGLATGGNIYVVDLDGAAGMAAWEFMIQTLPYTPTRTVITGGGGRHHYFRPPHPDLRNTHWKIAEGIDTRGMGGYVLLPPSNHVSGSRYEWAEPRLPTQPLPDWITQRVTPQRVTPQQAPAIRFGETTPYGWGVLRASVARISAAREGNRNETLNEEAFNVGQWIGGGLIDPRGVADQLIAACPDPDRAKVRSTVERALHDGAQHPRTKEAS